MASKLAPFDTLYRASSDPWGTTSRWYERRKRSLLLAALPCEHYRSVFEAGCGTGHISVGLAPRCDTLLATDGSVPALAIASRALAGHPNATVALQCLPQDWPVAAFDLIVLSEVLYFVDDTGCDALADAARSSAGASGTVVACNWRGPIEGWGHRGDEVHRRFDEALALPRLFAYADDDFLLSGWSRDATTPAMRDGLRA